MASKRVDDFALEGGVSRVYSSLSSLIVKYIVYEISLYLSVLFRSPAQTTSIVNQLIPHGRGIYDAHTQLSASHETEPSIESSTKKLHSLSLGESMSSRQERQLYRPPHVRREQIPYPSTMRSLLKPERPESNLWSNVLSTALIACFHILVHSYPSQSPYHSMLTSFQQSHFFQEHVGTKDILEWQWLKSIASAVASRNYARFGRLSSSTKVDDVCHRLGSLASRGTISHIEMRHLSLKLLVEDLRTKVRGTVWDILTVTYRELDTACSADWLLRSLMVAPDPMAENPQAIPSARQFVNKWLEQRGETEVRRKDGSQDRWTLCRRRS